MPAPRIGEEQRINSRKEEIHFQTEKKAAPDGWGRAHLGSVENPATQEGPQQVQADVEGDSTEVKPRLQGQRSVQVQVQQVALRL